MRELASYTDFFIIASASNRRQVQAIANSLRKLGPPETGIYTCKGSEGLEAARWVLVDFSDCVVHIFDEQLRGFYDLDGLWADAPRMETPDVDVVPDEEDDDEDDEDDIGSLFTL